MHEILTLQFGQQANFLGTHYWNTQESYFTYDGQEESLVDHDRSFRQGTGADGADTYTPRALIYDLKGAFGTLRRENELYRASQDAQQSIWNLDTLTIQLPPIAESPYQQALNAGTELPALTTETVRYWSDCNHVYYHPRSLQQLNEYELNSSLMPFENYETGEELFTSLDREHDILDRDLRPFVEECDQMQGIQIFSSTSDAWGGFAAKYAECISDELGKGSKVLFGLENSTGLNTRQIQRRTANVAKFTVAVEECISLQFPMWYSQQHGPTYLQMDKNSAWHTSALQATVAETLTLPSRLRMNDAQQASFSDIEAVLNTHGKRPISAVSASFSMPDRDLAAEAHDHRMSNGHAQNGADDMTGDIHMFPEHRSGGTGRNSSLGRPSKIFSTYTVSRDTQFDRQDAVLEEFDDSTKRLHREVAVPLHLLKSFPRILFGSASTSSLACETTVTSSEQTCAYLRQLAQIARSGLSIEDRGILETLQTLAEDYDESMEFDDSDFDDH